LGLLLFFLLVGLSITALARSSGYLRKAPALSAQERSLLTKYAISYQGLSVEHKQAFERTVSLFIHDKTWVGAGIKIHPAMKVMIGACAAQLLRGFPEVELKHFDRIVVFPDTYRSRKDGRFHQGEVRPQVGMIMISWDDFLHGYAHSREAHNVGLHEMAHALWFENAIPNGEQNFLDKALLSDWFELAQTEVKRIKAHERSFFRDYAGTNQAESFAVAVEYFFEQPNEFKQALPEHYATLSGL
jgi:Mlc titration factor MtfA (ptsG expression regulator)